MCREVDELGARIGRIGLTTHIPESLEVIDHLHHRLLRDAGAAGELAEPSAAAPIDVQEQGRVTGPHVLIASFDERVAEIARHGALRLEQQRADVGDPLHDATIMLVVVSRPELPPEHARTKHMLPELLATRRVLRRSEPLLPHAGPVDGEQTTGVGKSGTLRAAIFGVNDGLVSNAALIMGFAGADQGRSVILLAGISGLLAGAFSMAAGEYVSMRVQREVLERMLHLEAHELGSDPEGERRELAEIYTRKGISQELADRLATEISNDPKVALDTHAREELGIDPTEGLGSPVSAAVSSFLTFSVGALIPLIPFFFVGGTTGTVISATMTGVALLGVGALTSTVTGRPPVAAALRMLAIGGGAAIVTYLIGTALGVSVVG